MAINTLTVISLCIKMQFIYIYMFTLDSINLQNVVKWLHAVIAHIYKNLESSPSSASLSLKEPDRTIPMLRGRSASDSVLPSGDAAYSSKDAS